MKKLPVKYIFPINSVNKSQFGQVTVAPMQQQVLGANSIQSMNAVAQAASMPVESGVQGRIASRGQDMQRYARDKALAEQQRQFDETIDLKKEAFEAEKDLANLKLMQQLFYGQNSTSGATALGLGEDFKPQNVAQMNAIQSFTKKTQDLKNKTLNQLLENPNASPDEIMRAFISTQEEISNMSRETVNEAISQSRYYSSQLDKIKEGQKKGEENIYDTLLAAVLSQKIFSQEDPSSLQDRTNLLYANVNRIARERGENLEGWKQWVEKKPVNSTNWALLVSTQPEIATQALYNSLMQDGSVEETMKARFENGIGRAEGESYTDFKKRNISALAETSIKRTSKLEDKQYLPDLTEEESAHPSASRKNLNKKYTQNEQTEMVQEGTNVTITSPTTQNNEVEDTGEDLFISDLIKEHEENIEALEERLNTAKESGNTEEVKQVESQLAQQQSALEQRQKIIDESIAATDIDFKSRFSESLKPEGLTLPFKSILAESGIKIGTEEYDKLVSYLNNNFDEEDLVSAYMDYRRNKNFSPNGVDQENSNEKYLINSDDFLSTTGPFRVNTLADKAIDWALGNNRNIFHIGNMIDKTLSSEEKEVINKKLKINNPKEHLTDIPSFTTPTGGRLEEYIEGNVRTDLLAGNNDFTITGSKNKQTGNLSNFILSSYKIGQGYNVNTQEIINNTIIQPTARYDKNGDYILSITLPESTPHSKLEKPRVQYISVDPSIGRNIERNIEEISEVALINNDFETANKLGGILNELETSRGLYAQAQKLNIDKLNNGETMSIVDPQDPDKTEPFSIKKWNDRYIVLDKEGEVISFSDKQEGEVTSFTSLFGALHTYRLSDENGGFGTMYSNYFPRLNAAESTGSNKSSSATGIGQLTSGTFEDIRDLLVSEGFDQYAGMDFKTEYAINEEAQRHFTQRLTRLNHEKIQNDPEYLDMIENNKFFRSDSKKERYLKALYLSHHQGFDGAQHFLKTGKIDKSILNYRENNLQKKYIDAGRSDDILSYFSDPAVRGIRRLLNNDMININDLDPELVSRVKKESEESSTDFNLLLAQTIIKDVETKILKNKDYSSISKMKEKNDPNYYILRQYLEYAVIGELVSGLNRFNQIQ